MLINEVAKHADLSKRAIKYYEEKGLLKVEKDSNGYRNYSEKDILTLKKISVYRKLGISIEEIKILLENKDKSILENIYTKKQELLEDNQKELNALKEYIESNNIDAIYSEVDYKTIAQAIQDNIPGFYGYYFMNHFMPYLQIKITTTEQQEALKEIIDFWDNTKIKIPLIIKLISFCTYKFTPKPVLKEVSTKMNTHMEKYLNPQTEEEYNKIKEQIRQSVKLKNSLLYKYNPILIPQKRFKKQFQDCGYNDIFIPNMKKLSPKYKEYHDALTAINQRVCTDLGLYYDSNYNLIMKK